MWMVERDIITCGHGCFKDTFEFFFKVLSLQKSCRFNLYLVPLLMAQETTVIHSTQLIYSYYSSILSLLPNL